jgi:hypothetical protein
MQSHQKFEVLLSNFKKEILLLFDWCSFNRIDINYDKTYIMFIHNKRNIKLPKTIECGHGIIIDVVDEFKLLGVTIDSKLTFGKHIANVCMSINRKLYCLKRLFFLSSKIKLQFFKTFILPYFDYCSTLSIYLTKTTLLKLCTCFYFCLFKLFNWNFEKTESISDINQFLIKFNLYSFQHRCFYRISMFIYKVYFYQKPPLLYDEIHKNALLPSNSRLRSQLVHTNLIRVPFYKHKFGLSTFEYFGANFINTFFNNIPSNIQEFKVHLMDNLTNFYLKFCEIFSKFYLKTKTFFIKK